MQLKNIFAHTKSSNISFPKSPHLFIRLEADLTRLIKALNWDKTKASVSLVSNRLGVSLITFPSLPTMCV